MRNVPSAGVLYVWPPNDTLPSTLVTSAPMSTQVGSGANGLSGSVVTT